jgi:hypothetical protein
MKQNWKVQIVIEEESPDGATEPQIRRFLLRALEAKNRKIEIVRVKKGKAKK